MSSVENIVYCSLRDGKITPRMAVTLLVVLGHLREDAEDVVNEWTNEKPAGHRAKQ